MTTKTLLQQLHDADESMRMNAAQALAGHPSPETIEALIQALGDEEAVVIGAAMDTLTAFGEQVCPALYQHLTTDTARVRLGIVELLERFPSRESEIALRSALQDSDPSIRGAAARSLGTITPLQKETVRALEHLLTDNDPFPRYQALALLQKIDPMSKRETTIVESDLAAPSVDDRRAALTYIRDHHKTEWIKQIRALLEDSEPSIQQTAQWTLARLGVGDVDS